VPDANTWNWAWKSKFRYPARTFSLPRHFGDVLVCGEGLHTRATPRWSASIFGPAMKANCSGFETKNQSNAPRHLEGRVIVGAGDDGIYCLALRPEKAGETQAPFAQTNEEYPDSETSLAVTTAKSTSAWATAAPRSSSRRHHRR